jgi:hypothetical protein
MEGKICAKTELIDLFHVQIIDLGKIIGKCDKIEPDLEPKKIHPRLVISLSFLILAFMIDLESIMKIN